MSQWLMNLTRNHEVVGSIPGLASGLRIWRCCELWRRSNTWLISDMAVAVALATAPLQPLAWEPPYASYVALESKKEKKNFFVPTACQALF